MFWPLIPEGHAVGREGCDKRARAVPFCPQGMSCFAWVSDMKLEFPRQNDHGLLVGNATCIQPRICPPHVGGL